MLFLIFVNNFSSWSILLNFFRTYQSIRISDEKNDKIEEEMKKKYNFS